MIFWLNAQLPPTFAQWLSEMFSVQAVSLSSLGLRDAQDIDIFNAARIKGEGTVIITKDGFPRKAKKINGRVRCGAPHSTALS